MGPSLKSLTLKNILSFGPDTPPLELGPLNVFIGPNASGKSNVIDALSILRATPRDVQEAVRKLGGAREVAYGGAFEASAQNVSVSVATDHPRRCLEHVVRLLSWTGSSEPSSSFFSDEWVWRLKGETTEREEPPVLEVDSSSIRVSAVESGGAREMAEQGHAARPHGPWQSGLSQLRDRQRYPELAVLVDLYSGVRLYREWHVGRYTEPRRPQPADLPSACLDEDAANLALVVNVLKHGGQRQALYEALSRF